MEYKNLLDISEEIYHALPCEDEYNHRNYDCNRCKNKEMCDMLAALTILIRKYYL